MIRVLDGSVISDIFPQYVILAKKNIAPMFSGWPYRRNFLKYSQIPQMFDLDFTRTRLRFVGSVRQGKVAAVPNPD